MLHFIYRFIGELTIGENSETGIHDVIAQKMEEWLICFYGSFSNDELTDLW